MTTATHQQSITETNLPIVSLHDDGTKPDAAPTGATGAPIPPTPQSLKRRNEVAYAGLFTGKGVSADEFATFTRDGYVVMRRALDPAMVANLAPEATRLTILRHATSAPRETRSSWDVRSLLLRNAWQLSDRIRALVCSRRLAQLAGELLGASAVQLYSDVIVVKEPGCDESPWHHDSAYVPLDGASVVVAWIPLQPGGPDTAGLGIRPGSQHFAGAAALRPERDDSIRRFQRTLRRANYETVELETACGDVVFYAGRTCHSVRANRTTTVRTALSITYVRAEAPLLRPQNHAQIMEREQHLSMVTVGRPLHTPLHPLLWQR
jgi:ectoine hydroxylase-related dioxygenase (phytanoyl-CoA dioxygenase family)